MIQQYFYPQKMGRIMLLAMEEIIGVKGVENVLRFSSIEDLSGKNLSSTPDRTFPFETVSALQSALEKIYGPRGGRGIAMRVGRSTFRYGLKEYGSLLGLSETAFRLLPLPTKLRTGARVFADLFNKHTDQKVRLEEKEGKLYWHIERCPLCWERQVDEPACQLAVGLLQESLYWLSGGKVFNVEEVACIGKGDAACTIVIDETPIS